MKKLYLLTAGLLGVLLFFVQTASAGGRTERGIRFPSQYLEAKGEESGGSVVYLPEGYDNSDLRYPVMYNFHGRGGSPGQGALELADFDRLIDAGQMQPVIVVMTHREGFTFDNAGSEAYAHHIGREVVPYIDAHYRTIPRREARAVTGYSLGGRDAWEAGLRYPDLFSLVSSYALGNVARNIFPGLLHAHRQHRFPLEFWDYRGRNDNVVGSIRPYMDIMDQLHLPHTFVEDSGNHGTLGEDVDGVFHFKPLDNQIYYTHRLWEETNAADPFPVRRYAAAYSALSGAATALDIEVDLQPRQDLPNLSLDASALGLDADLPLSYEGDGRYLTRFEFTAPRQNGLYRLQLRRQLDDQAAEAFRTIRLAVYPSEDFSIREDDPAWEHNTRLTLDREATQQVVEGTHSLGVDAGVAFKLSWNPDQPPTSLGYSLHFAFHPGTAKGSLFSFLYRGDQGHQGSINLADPNNPPGQRIDMSRAEWQNIQIPLNNLQSSERLVFLEFGGSLSGTFYLDDVRLVPQPLPSPAPALSYPPALRFVRGTEDFPVVVDAIPAEVDIEIRAESRVEDLRPAMRLDGSAVGADAAMPLTSDGNGRYTARLPLDQTLPSGVYRLPVLMDSERQGTELFAALRLMVYPNAERSLYNENGLVAEIEPGRSALVELNPLGADQVFDGQTSLDVHTKLIARTGNYYMTWIAPEPIFGYDLHLAFHPGLLEAGDTEPVFRLGLIDTNGLLTYVPLIGPEASFNLQQQSWQTAEIPLGDLSIQSIVFENNLKGTFYLDDIRLVPQTPPPLPTAVVEQHQYTTPDDFNLDQNFPNPFNSGTVILFTLPQADDIRLTVFNLAGQRVADLIDGPRTAGAYTVHWDGRDTKGNALASGLYLYRLEAGDHILTRKLTLLR